MRAMVQPPGRIRRWLQAHKLSLAIVVPLLTAVGVIQSINFDGYPAKVVDDEGTYMAQAWAMLQNGEIAHYTYWYDHPFLGWLLLVPFLWLAEVLGRDVSAVTIGREAMIVFNLISCVLVYTLARRLRFNRGFAALAVGLFAFSPLAMHYHRMVFLDNISTMFILAALVLAVSPRRSIWAAVGCAVCSAAAFWTKETALILIIPVVYMLAQHSVKGRRLMVFVQYFAVLGVIGASYLGFAALKGELLPGDDHVSLYDTVKWQLFDRASDGSLLDPGSGTYDLARGWFTSDPYLLGLGVLAIAPVALVAIACLIVPRVRNTQYSENMRRLRPLAVGLAIQIIMMFRDGYMPYPYVTAMLPFAALLIAGVIDSHWHLRIHISEARHTSRRFALPRRAFAGAFAAMSLAMVAALGVVATPKWHNDLTYQLSSYETGPWEEATEWVKANLPKDAVIVVDDNLWPDLARAGFENHEWHDKVDADPEVAARLPNGWRDIDYVVLGSIDERRGVDMPTVVEAISHADQVAVFGDETLIAYRVNHDE